jgi:hypothetical protein
VAHPQNLLFIRAEFGLRERFANFIGRDQNLNSSRLALHRFHLTGMP